MPTPVTHTASQIIVRRAGAAAHDHACRPCPAQEVKRGVKSDTSTNACRAAHRKRRREAAIAHHISSIARANHAVRWPRFLAPLHYFSGISWPFL